MNGGIYSQYGYNNKPNKILPPASRKPPMQDINYGISFPLELPDYDMWDNIDYIDIDALIEFYCPGIKEGEIWELAVARILKHFINNAHSDRIPDFNQWGYLQYNIKNKRSKKNGIIDIHHITEQIDWHTCMEDALSSFPFSKDLAFLLKDATDNVWGQNGHFMANLIPLDYTAHHDYIHGRSPIRHIHTAHGTFPLDQVLAGFVIFNIDDRSSQLSKLLYRMQKRTTSRQYEILQRDLNNISVAAEVIKSKSPDLYNAWRTYVYPEEELKKEA